LPFLVLATVMVFVWARQILGVVWGVAAAVLFTTVAPVLAHAGLATTDMAATGTVAASLVALVIWLERPSIGHSLALGVAVGLALASKLSAPIYVCSAGAAIGLTWLATRPEELRWRERLLGIGAAAVIALLLLWAGYRFSVGPLLTYPP